MTAAAVATAIASAPRDEGIGAAIHVFVLRDGAPATTVAPDDLDSIRAAITDPHAVTWIRVSGHDVRAERIMREVLELHPLSIEDVWSDAPMPKIEDFGRYLYVIVHGLDASAESPEGLETVELDVFLGGNWVLSHESQPMRSAAAVCVEIERGTARASKGAVWIAHALLDHLTDHYAPLMDAFDDAIDALETEVVTNPTRDALHRIFALKRSLMKIRRVTVHQKEILLRLSRGEFDLVPERALPFFRDVYDHFARVADLCDGYRELVSGALDAYLTTASNRMNEIMKMLAGISTVMLPLTFVVGLYGMNFDDMPELHWKYGYPFALGLMAVLASILIIVFKKRRWF